MALNRLLNQLRRSQVPIRRLHVAKAVAAQLVAARTNTRVLHNQDKSPFVAPRGGISSRRACMKFASLRVVYSLSCRYGVAMLLVVRRTVGSGRAPRASY